jgi:protoporphyrinogen oxidase
MRTVILGGGISGLQAASRLLEKGFDVTLVEKEPALGGLCRSFPVGGCNFDLGPHNIHTDKSSIIAALKDLLGDDLLVNEARSQIYFQGKLVDYPFKGLSVFTSVNPTTALLCGADFLKTRLVGSVHNGSPNGCSYEEWVTQRFGRRLYDIYFRSYTEKVWGMHPSLLSPIFAQKRIPVLSLADLVKKYIFHMNGSYHSEDPDYVESFYPRFGIGQLVDTIAANLSQAGAEIHTGSEVTAVETSRGRVTGVTIRRGSEEICLEGDLFVNTMPITELVRSIRPSIEQASLRVAEELRYRSMVFVFMILRKREVLRTPWVYFSDPEVIFNRVYELAKFSPSVVGNGSNGLCFEISCFAGDRVWNMDIGEIRKAVEDPMVRLGFLGREDIVDVVIRKEKFVYPVFTKNYEQWVQRLLRCLGRYENIITLGRQGLFSYVNVDNCMEMADDLAAWMDARTHGAPDVRSSLFRQYRPDSSIWY